MKKNYGSSNYSLVFSFQLKKKFSWGNYMEILLSVSVTEQCSCFEEGQEQ